jgi:hypothetical protein
VAKLPGGYVDRTDLAWTATPSSLLQAPIHRWFTFPHSYSHALVETLIKEWDLRPDDRIYDPFVGAGTTLVVAKDHGISAVGIDVSPLSVLVSRVKIADYSAEGLEMEWRRLRRRLPSSAPPAKPASMPLVRRAFTLTAWNWLMAIRSAVSEIGTRGIREFFELAYLRAMREVCRAQSDGGWLRWTRRRPSGNDLPERMGAIVASMVDDIRALGGRRTREGIWDAYKGDARSRPQRVDEISAVICSPPYPNRHDYSRVFAPELLLAFCDEDSLKRLRYEAFRSHVEAQQPDYGLEGYQPPDTIARALKSLKRAPVTDRRVRPMVKGYFEDLFLMLKTLRECLAPGARLAFVVGNVRHAGVMVEVDEGLARIGESLGYRRGGTWVIRYRGNSAQQMGHFGRTPARESVVILRAG